MLKKGAPPMLKIYHVTNYISIDGADWREVRGDGYRVADSTPDLVLVENLSFDQAREYLSEHTIHGVHNDSTIWKKKPVVSVSYCDAIEPVRYKHFTTISYKKEFKEWTSVPMQWIIEHLSADECIQYLKDRGMIACPILK
jgi:hypothetical protein